ncbi:oxidoreductase [Butyrivibrio sp. INlla21]|uniref:oxidoreductase n=1 Tax=Butyrivibrio sp. INlla21 TaxID=1520811 RepID=UPI0008EF51C3|nr:FAD-dependent oxidoreductase [Butyrivibrio sp. INlla21]SFU60166.1 2,4-dienoyl-CoA reductase [Butyrivibrio sp. INlla21]
MYEQLFTEQKIGKVTSPNRLVFEPMGNYYAELDGSVSERDIAFYTERAKGGCGIVMTEVASVNSKTGRGNIRNICTDDDKFIPGYKKMADSIHKYGSLLFVELYHPGCQGIAPLNGGSMASPSGQESDLIHMPTHAMTVEEIHDTVKDFVDSAVRMQKAGVDGVVLHAAHGYLLCEFISSYTNHRTDEYGGSIENRVRIIKEIVEGIREKCGDYPIIIRYSADEYMREIGKEGGMILEEAVEMAKLFESYGVDALDVSAGNYETMNWAWEPTGFDEGWKMVNGATIAKAVKIPVIACSVIRTPRGAVDFLNKGVSFVGSARQFFADPYWGNKVKEGREKEIRKCISCLNCMESLMAADEDNGIRCQCTVNIEGGEECTYLPLKNNGDGKKVVILGAGPAGLEAARVAAERGFKPVIFEAAGEIGGQLNLANKPPKKDKITWLIEYYQAMIEKYGIEVRLNTEATAELIKKENPYKVINAIGSSPVLPRSIPGLDGSFIITPPDVLAGRVNLSGKRVCVVGSGMTGIETAEFLQEKGNSIELYEMADDIGPGLFFQNLIDVMGRLAPGGCKFFAKHQLVSVDEHEAKFNNLETGKEVTASYDNIVISLGTRSNAIAEDIAKEYPDMITIGDAEKAGRIRHAVEGGYKAALSL